MPDYREMYTMLFREATKAISNLQKVQQQTEEMYISGNSTHNLFSINNEKKQMVERKITSLHRDKPLCVILSKKT